MAIIKTLGDFRRSTKNLDDDFSIEFCIRTRVPEEELKNRRYPYPYDTEYFDGFEFVDVGYSDKVACFGVTLEAPEDMYKTHKTACDNCEDNQYCSQSEYVKKNCYKL